MYFFHIPNPDFMECGQHIDYHECLIKAIKRALVVYGKKDPKRYAGIELYDKSFKDIVTLKDQGIEIKPISYRLRVNSIWKTVSEDVFKKYADKFISQCQPTIEELKHA